MNAYRNINVYRNIHTYKNLNTYRKDYSNPKIFIVPEFFKEVNKLVTADIYSMNKDLLKKFKGFCIFIHKGSKGKLPNTPETIAEFYDNYTPSKNIISPKVRISMMFDAKNNFIIDSSVTELSMMEQKLAFQHIEKADEIVNLKKSINLFEQYHTSLELILQLLSKKSYFIFKLKKDTYSSERNTMNTDDEWIDINLDEHRVKRIKNEKLKATAKELGFLRLRIINTPLKTGKTQTLLTNISSEIGKQEELNDLYGEISQINKTYDVLKNKLHIGIFSGEKRIEIEQGFYSQILMYNILMKHENC